MPRANASRKRCAIYTRKSSEEGLEQEFNSLAAQCEACEAFIRSQRNEGWVLVRTRYDALKWVSVVSGTSGSNPLPSTGECVRRTASAPSACRSALAWLEPIGRRARGQRIECQPVLKRGKGPAAAVRAVAQAANITNEINRRNQERLRLRLLPYPYFLPTNIPNGTSV